MVRFALTDWFKSYQHLLTGTFISNIISCAILAICAAKIQSSSNQDMIKYLLMIGFCGGFSTFSTFTMELFQCLEQKQWQTAIAYIGISIISCLLVFSVCYVLAKKL